MRFIYRFGRSLNQIIKFIREIFYKSEDYRRGEVYYHRVRRATDHPSTLNASDTVKKTDMTDRR